MRGSFKVKYFVSNIALVLCSLGLIGNVFKYKREGLVSLQGFLMFQHLAMQGTWTVFWADYLHKVARKSAMALSSSSADQFLKKMNKLFRLTRGPYGSGKFGKQLLNARETLMEAIKKHEVDSMLDTWLPGCAKDNGRLDGRFHVSELLATLKTKTGWGGDSKVYMTNCLDRVCNFEREFGHASILDGTRFPVGCAHLVSDQHKDSRWFSWYDHGQGWNARWHTECLCLAFSFWSEGQSPWHLAPQSDDSTQSYSMRIFAWNATRLTRLG